MLPKISPSWLKWFKRYLRYWYVPLNLHAIRVSRRGALPAIPDGPLIVVSNHPSWWDPIVLMLLSDLMPHRRHFAPIDAAALERYRFFTKLGMFGIEPGTPAGARRFLRIGKQLLEQPDSVLWITAQGRFADARERPVRLQAGVGHLAARVGSGHILPVALEYTYWQERTPEALVHFGDLIPIRDDTLPADWLNRIEWSLLQAQDALADAAIQQRPELFDTYVAGKVGVGLAYDLWHRARARWHHQPYDGHHATVTRRNPAC